MQIMQVTVTRGSHHIATPFAGTVQSVLQLYGGHLRNCGLADTRPDSSSAGSLYRLYHIHTQAFPVNVTDAQMASVTHCPGGISNPLPIWHQ